nr:uncharacterized protein LOC109416775 [Aedes albopictus]
MWFRTLCGLVIIVVVVDSRRLARSKAVVDDRNDSSGSDEAEIFVSHDSEGKAVVSKQYLHPPPGKNVYMVKRVNAKTPAPVTERLVAVTSKSWTKILNKLGDVHEVESSEEEEAMVAPLDVRLGESNEGVLSEEVDEVKSPSDPMVIAQKLFPVLLRRAIDNVMQNISKHDVVDLMDELSKRAWINSESERRLTNRLLEDSHRGCSRHNDMDVDAGVSSKKKRSYYPDNSFDNDGNTPPYVVNIFNNSHIGYLVLKPACNVTGVNTRNCSGQSPVVYGPLAQSLNFTFALPNFNVPCVQPSGSFNLDFLPCCGKPPMVHPETCTPTTEETTTTSTTTTTTTTTTPCPTTTTTTEPSSTCEPSTIPTTTCEAPTLSTVHHPPYYHPMLYHGPHEPHVRHWYKIPQIDYYHRKPPIVPRSKYEERVIYDPYKHLAYDDVPGEDRDCSDEEDRPSENFHVKREPQRPLRPFKRKPHSYVKPTTTVAPLHQSLSHSEEAVRLIIDLPPAFNSEEIRDDTHLMNTLAKIGLSLDTERPPVAKPVPSIAKSRYRTLAPTRSPRMQHQYKAKDREPDEKPQKRPSRATMAPAMFLF